MNTDLHTSICSAGLEGSVSGLNGPGSGQSVSPKQMPKRELCSDIIGQECQTSEISGGCGRDVSSGLLSLRVACLASLRVFSDECAELLTSAGCGLKQSEFYASFDRATGSLRTRQASLALRTGEPGMELCRDWSRAGLIVGGMYFRLPRLVQGICESVCCSLLPTPKANKVGADHNSPSVLDGRHRISLPGKVARVLLPTPTASSGGSEPEGETGRKLITVVQNGVASDTNGSGRGEGRARGFVGGDEGKAKQALRLEFANADSKRRGEAGKRVLDGASADGVRKQSAADDSEVAANSDGAGFQGHAGNGAGGKGRPGAGRPVAAPDLRGRVNGADWWHEVVTGIPVLVDGLPNRLVEAISRCIGNSILPQIPFCIGKAIVEIEGGRR